MERPGFKTTVIALIIFFLYTLSLSSCVGIGKGVSEIDISIPPEMNTCPPGVQATDNEPCYEGKWIENDDGSKSLRETCGKYWDLEPEHQAVMAVNDCRKRNDAVLKYHLFWNRGQLKDVKKMLEEGI